VLQAGRSRFRLSMGSLIFYSTRNPSGRTVALGFTQPIFSKKKKKKEENTSGSGTGSTQPREYN
jgi:hypothetical protein